MNEPCKPLAKATRDSEASDAVVVSFDHEWYQPLRSKAFRAVIRKRVPKTFSPRWLYFHVNSPVSAICARGKLESVGVVPLKEALGLQQELKLSDKAILAYVGRKTDIGLYRLESISLAAREATIGSLSAEMAYFPPQSFFRFSEKGKAIADRICGF